MTMVMPRTLAPAPPTDRRFWRLLFKVVHPDAHGGSHELFLWCTALFEHVAGDYVEPLPPRARRQPPPHPTSGERVDFTRALNYRSFVYLTRAAVAMADKVEEPYAGLLRLLEDCHPAAPSDIGLTRQEQQGCTYRTLAAIGHQAGMNTVQRGRWYRVVESVPLSQRHGGHILSKLKAS
jgi:hypothetical protein